MEDVLLVISTFPDAETAQRIATELVTAKLAACANILPAVQSIYRWKGALENATETMAFFKTTRARYAAVEEQLRALHPYETPEIVAFPVENGLADHLSWVGDSCAP